MKHACLPSLLSLVTLTACTPEQADHATRERGPDATLTAMASPATLAAALGVAPESLRAAGEERYGRQAYDSARAIWRVELERARAASDARGEARTRMWLGLAAWRLGDYAVARSEGEAALAAKRALALDDELSRSFNALGLLAWNEGRHREALEHFDSAVVSGRRHDDSAGVARAIANVPLVKVELGDFDGARRGMKEALILGAALGDERTQGNALANLAMLEIRLGAAALAPPLLARARAHYAAIDYATGESNALGQLATARAELGDLPGAIAAADSALTIARERGLLQEVAVELGVIADLHVRAGAPRLALRRLAAADSLATRLGLVVERGVNHRRVAAILLELGETSVSVDRARQALGLHVGAQAHGEVVHDRLQLARSLSRGGDMAAAGAQADSAHREAARAGNPATLREAAVAGARLALDAGDAARALARLDAVTLPHEASNWRLDDLRAEALHRLGRLRAARHAGEQAVASLERDRALLASNAFQGTSLVDRSAPYSRLVTILLAAGDTAAAFRVAASLPGRRLAEHLGVTGGATRAVSSVVAGERLLLRAAALERQLAELDGADVSRERRRALAHALAATRAEYEEHVAHRTASADARRLGVGVVSLAEVQSRLARDEALLSWLAGEDHLTMFVVRATRVFAQRVPVGDRAIGARARVARDLLAGDAHAPALRATLGDLHDLLLAPAIAAGALERVTRVRVVPHGALAALPFAALWNRRTGRFVVEDHVVSYVPSVAAMTVPRAAPDHAARRLVVFAPFPDSLPGTGREARAIARRVPHARLRLGGASRESSLRSALAEGRSIHVASHGAYNAQNPLFSRIAAGRAHGVAGRDDGQLEVHEILGLRTVSPLVFLSGCETGLGTGEGAFASGLDPGSLAQAFLAAGAGGVVATLWRVQDADAERVATGFYAHLATGASPEDALARTQRDAIRASTGGFTWAAYTVSGSRRANPDVASVIRE